MALGPVPEGERVSLVDESGLRELVARLMRDRAVIGPVSKGKDYVFSEIRDPGQLGLAYQTTVLPPKKALARPLEVLFRFEEGTISTDDDVRPQALFGIHACDLHAISILDTVFRRDYPDPYFVKRKDATLIVALNCTTVGENCFCASMGTGPWVQDPCDLVLTPLGSKYLVEPASERGAELAAGLEPAPGSALAEKAAALEDVRRHFKKSLDTDHIREVMERGFEHPVWDELMKDCLGCGSCTVVCPTCFCYNVVDKLDLSLKSGRREREWDSCMLLEYAEVALGANFRKDRDARIKQRMYHKLAYYEPQFGTLGCVGCGRCVASCVKKIDITEVAARLRGD